jgi:hypothetical protein
MRCEIGSALTGHSNVDDWLNRFICGCIQLNMFPDHTADDVLHPSLISQRLKLWLVMLSLQDISIDWVCVDYVAKAACALSLFNALSSPPLPSSLSSPLPLCYHLCDPFGPTLPDHLFVGITTAGYLLRRVSPSRWVEGLTNAAAATTTSSSMDNRCASLRDMFATGLPAGKDICKGATTAIALCALPRLPSSSSPSSSTESKSVGDTHTVSDVAKTTLVPYSTRLSASVIASYVRYLVHRLAIQTPTLTH